MGQKEKRAGDCPLCCGIFVHLAVGREGRRLLKLGLGADRELSDLGYTVLGTD